MPTILFIAASFATHLFFLAGGSLVLCLVAEAVEVPQDRLAEVEVASVEVSSEERRARVSAGRGPVTAQ